jgi:RHS repeat-associated protein
MNPHYRVGSHTPMSGRPETQFLYFYHPDHLGSTEFVTDTDGELYEHAQYFPSGESWVREDDGADRLPWLFTSQELDAETGLYYLNARYYDPRVGVFTSTDPALGAEYWGTTGFDPGLRGVYEPRLISGYCYANNSPIMYSDPGGRCPICVAVVVIIALATTPSVAGDLDPEHPTPRPSDASLVVHTAIRSVPVGGMVVGTVAGVADVAVDDADRGEFSSPATYGTAATLGALSGALGGRTSTPTTGPAVAVARELTEETVEAGGRTVGREAVEAVAASCPGGSCVCFAAATPIHTVDGVVPVEEVEVGDYVLSRHEDTGAFSYSAVTRLFVTPGQQVLDIGIASEDGGVEHLRVTPTHLFWRLDYGWIVAGDLRPGDWLTTASGGATTVVSSVSVGPRVTVYNFEVETTHTYFAGFTGVWVHNDCWDDIARHAIDQGHLYNNGRDIAGLARHLRAWAEAIGANAPEYAERYIISRRGAEVFVRRPGGSGSWWEADSIEAAERYVARELAAGATQL